MTQFQFIRLQIRSRQIYFSLYKSEEKKDGHVDDQKDGEKGEDGDENEPDRPEAVLLLQELLLVLPAALALEESKNEAEAKEQEGEEEEGEDDTKMFKLHCRQALKAKSFIHEIDLRLYTCHS